MTHLLIRIHRSRPETLMSCDGVTTFIKQWQDLKLFISKTLLIHSFINFTYPKITITPFSWVERCENYSNATNTKQIISQNGGVSCYYDTPHGECSRVTSRECNLHDLYAFGPCGPRANRQDPRLASSSVPGKLPHQHVLQTRPSRLGSTPSPPHSFPERRLLDVTRIRAGSKRSLLLRAA